MFSSESQSYIRETKEEDVGIFQERIMQMQNHGLIRSSNCFVQFTIKTWKSFKIYNK